MVERRSINQELRVVMTGLVHLEAEMYDLDEVVLEDVRLENKRILAVLLALLVGSAARSHRLNQEQDLVDKLEGGVELFVRNLLFAPVFFGLLDTFAEKRTKNEVKRSELKTDAHTLYVDLKRNRFRL